jgi:hypothetical protein
MKTILDFIMIAATVVFMAALANTVVTGFENILPIIM